VQAALFKLGLVIWRASVMFRNVPSEAGQILFLCILSKLIFYMGLHDAILRDTPVCWF
jgi:predicted alpha-1,6-mannanase (GH76 family)